MAYRGGVRNPRKDKRFFTRTAMKVHPRNYRFSLRGGIRM